MKNKNKNVVWATFRTATQLVAIMAVILVTLITCGKSDSGGSVQNKDLIGSWVLESMTIDGVPTPYNQPSEGFIDKPLEKCDTKPFLVFLEKELTLTVVGKHYNFKKVLEKCELETSRGKYTVSGNTISIIWENNEGGAGIISIVNNKLILNGKNEEGKNTIMTFVKQ